jgi:GNAT superfamily N-acetyltransferase
VAALGMMSTDSSQRTIRKFQPADAAEVVEVWHRAGIAAYTFLPTWQAFTLEQAHWVFDHIIRPNCAIWVATLDERVVAYLAMKGTYINRLYVDPLQWRKGWGSQLVNFAKQVSPCGLELHTHQENLAARRSMNVTASGRSNSASVRRLSLHPMSSTIGVLSSHPAVSATWTTCRRQGENQSRRATRSSTW